MIFTVDYDDGKVKAKAGDGVPASIALHRVKAMLRAKMVRKIDPLDHDGDGAKGGSLPGPRSTAAKGARRRKVKP